MPDPNDAFALMQDSMNTSREQYLKIIRSQRDDEISRPLFGRKLKPDERRAALVNLVTQPVQLQGVVGEMQARFNLQEDKPIPKRLAEYLQREFKALRVEAEAF